MKRHHLAIAVALAVIILVGLGYTGYVTFHETEQGVVVGDAVIQTSELKECCLFEEDGKGKTCSVIAPYDCSYCSEFC